MSDYKDKQAVIDAVSALPTWYGDAGCLPFGDPQPPMEALLYPEDVVSAIENVPSADVEPVRHGRWERLVGDSRFMCSVCKWKEDVPTCNGEPTIWDYCPSCGARMDGDDNAE